MINFYNEQQAGVGNWEVWTNPDDDYEDMLVPKTGRCIGVGTTKEDAVKEAIAELEDDIRQLKRKLPE